MDEIMKEWNTSLTTLSHLDVPSSYQKFLVEVQFAKEHLTKYTECVCIYLNLILYFSPCVEYKNVYVCEPLTTTVYQQI